MDRTWATLQTFNILTKYASKELMIFEQKLERWRDEKKQDIDSRVSQWKQ